MDILITGGCGFIGTNLAAYFLKKRNSVTIFDNFSRKGTINNARYLSKIYPNISIIKADVRDYNAVRKNVEKNEIIFHLAGQVAVTTSIENPREDFEANVLGTFNVLEAARAAKHKPIIIDSSTNKVYGDLKGIVKRKGERYVDISRKESVAESESLDFYSPYGCSKGAADQYVRDYARIYDLPTVVFRQSCIYGPHQFGIEDQGWIAHFAIKALLGKTIAIYGTGYQVRDALFIDDLIDAYHKAIIKIKTVKGEVFNIGGGIKNTVSLLELISLLEKLLGKKINLRFEEKRPGDQDVYISNVGKAHKLLGWQPETTVEKGLKTLIDWLQDNLSTIKNFA